MKRGLPVSVRASIGLTLVLISFLAAVLLWSWPDDYLHIVVCDVGQGDALILSQRFTQLVIDSGVNQQGILQCLREHQPFWDRQIEWIVPTHLDADHIGGFAEVLDRFSVLNILLPIDTKENAVFEAFEQAVLREQSGGARVVSPVIGESLEIYPGWDAVVLYAPLSTISPVAAIQTSQTETRLWDAKTISALNPKESNNRSTVLSVQYGEVSILLTGDLEEAVEQALVERGMVEDHTILKVGHHGSKSSSSEAFLQVVRPEVALISSGRNNTYGHPSPLVLHRLMQFGVKEILRTDQLGTILLKSDGRSVWRVTDKQKQVSQQVGRQVSH